MMARGSRRQRPIVRRDTMTTTMNEVVTTTSGKVRGTTEKGV